MRKESRIPREQLAEAAQVKQTLRQYLSELEEQNFVELYFCSTVSSARTSSLWLLGSTSMYSFTIFPWGSMRKV